MDNTKVLTIEAIDIRLSEINTRLTLIADELKKETAELGSARFGKLSTTLINNAIDRLEHERRELMAEKEFIEQGRQLIQTASTREIAEAAATEYKALLEQLNPRAIEICKGLYVVQSQLIELENIQSLMAEKAPIAGKLVDPIPYDSTIVIQVDLILSDISRALSQIVAFNGRENVEKLVHIPDPDEQRETTLGRFSMASSKRAPAETIPAPKGFTESARRGANLPG